MTVFNDRLLNNLIEQDFAGYDIFDGLNSPILHKLGLYRFPLVRLAWIQFFKHSPINFRFLACIPKKRNCKGVAIIILGLLEDYARTQQQKFLDQAIDWAIENMYLEKTGYFRCQITRWYKNDICYLRWTQAWTYYSIAFYLNQNINIKNESN